MVLLQGKHCPGRRPGRVMGKGHGGPGRTTWILRGRGVLRGARRAAGSAPPPTNGEAGARVLAGQELLPPGTKVLL